MIPATPMENPPATHDARFARCIACRHSWVTDAASWGPGMMCPACSIPAIPEQFFGHYQIVREIASGGLGTVHEAIDSFTGRTACVKLLRDEIFADQNFVADFAREAQIAASISHPNVVQIYEFSQCEGIFYLAMEFLDHGTLQSRMASGSVPEPDLLRIALDVARGLQAASAKGLLHRDVKPGNILFDSFDRAKLVDFGLSLSVDETRRQRGLVWGSPYYIAPERLEGEPEDFRSDIYSLGATIFHAAAGRPLFKASSASLMAWKHLKAQKVSVKAFAPHLHDETAWIINRCVQREPGNRFASYFELIEAIESAKKLVALAPSSPDRQDLSLEAGRAKSSSRLRWAAGVAAMAVVGISLATLATLRSKERDVLDVDSAARAHANAAPSAPITPPATQAQADDDATIDIGHGWRSAQIGEPKNRGGTIAVSPEATSLWHEGKDIWGNADSCCFIFKRASGDLEMIAKVEPPRGGHEQWNKAGIMLRASLDPGAINAFLMVAPESGTRLQRRLVANDITEPIYKGDQPQVEKRRPPVWLKLVRAGGTVIAFDSTDGPAGPWRQRDKIEIGLPQEVLIGPAICAHGTEHHHEADFNDIRLSD